MVCHSLTSWQSSCIIIEIAVLAIGIATVVIVNFMIPLIGMAIKRLFLTIILLINDDNNNNSSNEKEEYNQNSKNNKEEYTRGFWCEESGGRLGRYHFGGASALRTSSEILKRRVRRVLGSGFRA